MKTSTALFVGLGLVAAYILYDRMVAAKVATVTPDTSGPGVRQLFDLGANFLGTLGGKPSDPSSPTDTYQGPPGAYGLDGNDYATREVNSLRAGARVAGLAVTGAGKAARQ